MKKNVQPMLKDLFLSLDKVTQAKVYTDFIMSRETCNPFTNDLNRLDSLDVEVGFEEFLTQFNNFVGLDSESINKVEGLFFEEYGIFDVVNYSDLFKGFFKELEITNGLLTPEQIEKIVDENWQKSDIARFIN